eukprot:1794412-Pyramimonas_sp.AAC.1
MSLAPGLGARSGAALHSPAALVPRQQLELCPPKHCCKGTPSGHVSGSLGPLCNATGAQGVHLGKAIVHPL